MYSFNNDYSEGAHPAILEAIAACNMEQNPGYSLDEHTKNAISLIRREIGCSDADIHCITGGTQTNLITISSALKPWQAVISAETGHINVHETGAIEAAGHKVLAIHTLDGKLTPDLILPVLDCHCDEHMVQPKMVYVSNATEVGTQYTKKELEALYQFCQSHNLYLFLDGARLGSALTSPVNDLALCDLARLCDVFYIGGTKNGALFGEALIICHPDLKPDFRYLIKQRGAMLAKGWLLGIQFEQLFHNKLFYQLASHANAMAGKMRKGISDLGYSYAYASTTNQLFPILPDSILEPLSKEFLFSVQGRADETHSVIRLVTSWATHEEAVDQLIGKLSTLSKLS